MCFERLSAPEQSVGVPANGEGFRGCFRKSLSKEQRARLDSNATKNSGSIAETIGRQDRSAAHEEAGIPNNAAVYSGRHPNGLLSRSAAPLPPVHATAPMKSTGEFDAETRCADSSREPITFRDTTMVRLYFI